MIIGPKLEEVTGGLAFDLSGGRKRAKLARGIRSTRGLDDRLSREREAHSAPCEATQILLPSMSLKYAPW